MMGNHKEQQQSDSLLMTNKSGGLSALQQKFQRKLEGARFRSINEKLYCRKGEDSFQDFQEDPSLFGVYHEGFREQVKSWPVNPLDVIIKWIKDHHHKVRP